MDYVDVEGRRIISMMRYNPFAMDKTIRIRCHHVTFMNVVLDEVEGYYRTTLKYHVDVIDENFRKGMTSAASLTNPEDPSGQVMDQPRTIH